MLGSRIKLLRKERGLTLEQLAKDLNTAPITLSRYENELRDPKCEVLKSLAEYFDVSVDYLIGNSDIRNKAENPYEVNDLKDIMDDILTKVGENNSIMFDGVPMTKDEMDAFSNSLEVVVALAKKKRNI